MRVLAQGRWWSELAPRRGAEAHRRGDGADLSFGGMLEVEPETEMPRLRVLEHLGERVDGGVRHIVLFEDPEPVGTRALPELGAEQLLKLLDVLDAVQARGEPRVLEEVPSLHAAHQSLPELAERREMDRDDPVVLAGERVGLRRSAAGGGT